MQWKFSFRFFFSFNGPRPSNIHTSSDVSSGMCVFTPSVSWWICFDVLLCRQNSSEIFDISENTQEQVWQPYRQFRSAANHRSASANLYHKSKRNVTQFIFFAYISSFSFVLFFPIGFCHSRQMISSKILTIFTNFLQNEMKNSQCKKN